MKTVRFVFCFVLALFVSGQIALAQDGKKLFVEDELLIKYKGGTASNAARSINAQVGASVLEEFPDLGWQRVKLPAFPNGIAKMPCAFSSETISAEVLPVSETSKITILV